MIKFENTEVVGWEAAIRGMRNPMFDTKRTDIGELVYRLKYRNDSTVIDELASVAAEFINSVGIAKKTTVILPAPPTKKRQVQPVFMISEAIANKLGIFYIDDVLQKEGDTEAKNVPGNTHSVVRLCKHLQRTANFLLIDDIFNTGETLSACVSALRDDPLTREIYVLTMTKRQG